MYIILHFSWKSGNIYLWWNSYKHVLDISKMHTYVPWYIDLSNFTSSFRISIATKFSEKMLLLWKFGFAIIASDLSSQCITSRTWLRIFFIVLLKIALFINLNKFFSNSFFAKILKFVLSSMYAKPCRLHELQYTIYLCNANEYIAADCDNVWRNTFYHIMSQGASPLACRVSSRALDKTIDRSAHHGYVTDTPSQSRDCNPSVNLTWYS